MAEDAKPSPAVYVPTDDERKIAAEVNDHFERMRELRRPHEIGWFLAAAYRRGEQNLVWNEVDARYVPPPFVPHRKRRSINLILPKIVARRAKATKNRPMPTVRPASTDRNDVLNARATEKAFQYIWKRLELERRYGEAIEHAEYAGRGYWWFSWNEDAEARVLQNIPGLPPKEGVIQDGVQLGDVEVEVGSAFEVLVSDPVLNYIQDQPEIFRQKLRPVGEVQARYPEFAEYITGDSTRDESFQYEARISSLHGRSTGLPHLTERGRVSKDDKDDMVLVKEFFQRPTPEYPQGRYVVMVGDIVLRNDEELPYELGMTKCPYPVVEFVDLSTAGQYWGTTVLAQLIDLQREYNELIGMLDEQIALMSRPKIIFYKQHQMPEGAWTSEAGELIELNHLPGLPPPLIIRPENVSGDLWRRLQMIQEEFEKITMIFPESSGAVGQSKSGFQTNLLQEASDSVHAPYIRGLELSVERAGWIARHLMKRGYTVPRLLSITGKNAQAEVFEFSQRNIDENADVVVEAGSALPTFKAARVQSVLELFGQGLFGDPADPEVRRKVLGMLDLGTIEEGFESYRRDEDQARLEQSELQTSGFIPPPEFYERHDLHYAIHTDFLKSPEAKDGPEYVRAKLTEHVIRHAFFIDPNRGRQLAAMNGLQHLVMEMEQAAGVPPQQALPPAAPGAQPPPQQPPPQGAPPAPPQGQPR